MKAKEKISKAVELGIRYGQIDGAHHKTWVIDQMIRILCGKDYENTIQFANGSKYDWDTGIAP